jgi:hypothetical protein
LFVVVVVVVVLLFCFLKATTFLYAIARFFSIFITTVFSF